MERYGRSAPGSLSVNLMKRPYGHNGVPEGIRWDSMLQAPDSSAAQGREIMLLLFFCVWIIFNGTITAEIAVIGAVIVLFMFAFICRFMDYSLKQEILLYKRSICLLRYILVLVMEIVKANIAVIRLITSNSEVVEPVMVRVHTNLKSNFCRVLLANSITLTPGTITVSMDGDECVVHCLDKSLSEGMEDSVFVKMLEKLERIGE